MAALRDQLIDGLRVAMRGDGLYTVLQKNLAAAMGVTEKHVSQMFKHQAGSWAMFDKAADALGYEWSVTLKKRADGGTS